MYQIRPFCEDDRAVVVEIDNRDRPDYRKYTVEDQRKIDRARDEREVFQRWVIGKPAIGYVEIVDMGTTHPGLRGVQGVCEFDLFVAHEQRRCGVGSALYERVLTFAHEREAEILRVWFYQYASELSGIDFLKRRGFIQDSERQTWYVDLTTYDFYELGDLSASMEWQGVRLLIYGLDLPDTADERYKLYMLYKELEHIRPDTDYEIWAKANVEGVDWDDEGLVIAEQDGKWIALSNTIAFNQEAHSARIRYTGTLPAYRGRSIATALKLRAMDLMKQRGYRILLTSNRKNNEPILAINCKLGFEPGPVELTYIKLLH